ncbi:MAG: hypothetical protein LAP86_26645 [Acidobacteriia bacterium]|nr:hypothetical protein [Terriglobia bacterium]
MLQGKYSRKAVYEQQPDVRPKQANSRALNARAMLHDTSSDKRKHKKRANDYSRAEDLLPVHQYNPFVCTCIMKTYFGQVCGLSSKK